MRQFFDLKFLKLLVLFVILLTGNYTLNGQQRMKKSQKPEYEIEITVAGIYDDNILKYSDKYIDRFLNHQDEGRFHIETYDDLILETTADISLSQEFLKNKKTEFAFGASRKTYMTNSIKSWESFNISIRQFFTRQSSVKLYINVIPEFYVRHFRDKQWVDIYGYTPNSFQSYSFYKELYGIWYQNTYLKNSRIRIGFDYARYLYNKHFTEYDSKNFIYGIKLFQPIHKHFRLDLGYDLTISEAKAYDASVETKENATSSDASYFDNTFSLCFLSQLPALLKKKHQFQLEYNFSNTAYQSDLPAETDPLHAGRYDLTNKLISSYSFQINKSINIELFYNRIQRNSDTKAEINQELVSEEKDYKQNIFGIAFKYTIK